MREVAPAGGEPQRELVLAIAQGLLLDGMYSVELDDPSFEQLQDVRWATREVGRLFRIPTAIDVRRPTEPDDGPVTVTVTRRDAIGRGQRGQRLEVLLRAVERDYLRVVKSRRPSSDDL